MSGVVFCCCSSQRAELLVQKTLKTLARGHFTSVLWLVVPSEEVAAYTEKVTGNQIMCMIQAAPERGLIKQRKFFREQMAPGTEIVFIDDDIEAIKIKGPDGLRHVTRVETLAEYVFQSMFNFSPDCLLAGVYPIVNRDWQKECVTSNNTNIVGALYFCKNDPRLEEPEGDIDGIEDLARCIKEQSSGRPTLRFNFIGIQTKYFKNPGGIPSVGRMEKREHQIDDLVASYPAIVKKIIKRSGMLDLKFHEKPVRWTEAVLPSQ